MPQPSDWNQRIWTTIVGLLILGVAKFMLPWIDWPLAGLIAGLIIVSGLLPVLIGNFVSALGGFVIAWVVWKFYMIQGWRIPAVIAAVGALYLGSAFVQLARARSARAAQ